MYKLTEQGVLRLLDNAWIPDCEDNRDWIEYQAWLAEDNTPEPMDIPVEVISSGPSLEDKLEALTKQVEALTLLLSK